MGDLPDGFLLPSVVKAGKAFLTPKIVSSNSISKHTWHLLHRHVILTFFPHLLEGERKQKWDI